MNVMGVVNQDLTLEEYRELAEFRHQIRSFQSDTEKNAHALGLNADAYLLLLAIQGLPEGARPTVAGIAERMCLNEEAVSSLVEDASARSEVIRSTADGSGPDPDDWVKLTRIGRETLRRMAVANRDELERSGAELVHALQSVLKQRRRRHRGVA